jgi:membrane protein
VAEQRDDSERSAEAHHPQDIPLSSWGAILRRLWLVQTGNGLWVMAAGIAYYGILSILPGLGFVMLTLGMIHGPESIKSDLQHLDRVLPVEALTMFVDQFAMMLNRTGGTLRWGITGSLLLMLWSVWLGMRALIAALNLAYREQECRSFLRLNAVALLLGIGGLAFVPLTFGVFLEGWTLFPSLGLSAGLAGFLRLARWPVLIILILMAMAILYRLGPCRAAPKWRWVSWGAATAAVLWLGASALFTAYAQHVVDYESAYGIAGAIITLLLWLNLIAYAILLGGALNAEMERQTTSDTTSSR